MNWQLFSVMSSIASTVLAGILITIALVLRFDTIPQITIAAIAGIILSLPIAYVLTKKVQTLGIAKSSA